MHVGAILIFEGPPPELRGLPRARRAAGCTWCPASARSSPSRRSRPGRPFWVDDPNFNLAYHVRHSALPAPGSEEQLRNIAGRLFSQALDRSKPLWELWLVQGLERNRFAPDHQDPPRARRRDLRRRHRHGPLRRQAGARADRARPRLGAAARRRRPPSSRRAGVAERGRDPASSSPDARSRAASDPGGPAARVAEARRGARRGRLELRPTPPPSVPLNVEIGSHRRFAWTRAELADFKTDQGRARRHGQRRRPHGRQRRAAQLAATAAASAPRASSCGRWCRSRSGAEDEHGQLGNRIAAMRGPLPGLHRGPGEAAARWSAGRWTG